MPAYGYFRRDSSEVSQPSKICEWQNGTFPDRALFRMGPACAYTWSVSHGLLNSLGQVDLRIAKLKFGRYTKFWLGSNIALEAQRLETCLPVSQLERPSDAKSGAAQVNSQGQNRLLFTVGIEAEPTHEPFVFSFREVFATS